MKLHFFPASNPNKTGVLVVPGGGYEFISMEKEGTEPAAWLNERGYDAWILEYTTAARDTPPPIYPKPMEEAREAIRQIRAQQRVSKLGIWGWSAGGHLSAVCLTDPEPALALDFGILAYPVISMEPGTTHAGSLANLLGGGGGDDDDDAHRRRRRLLLSAETRVSDRTPPVFLFHTADDALVPVRNSLLFAAQMARRARPFEILVLPSGPHGVGLALGDPKTSWTAELERWLRESV
ncbi:Alpha/Beta hydrolase protein [Biscogniauxia mediterranea]|nr:Alpha/Beta hydrolase protein [Biscogniauxia mediterranea]